MLHIILTILKIILWILLGILGLALLLVLVLAFAPIRYKVDASYYDRAKVRAKINFLIASLSVAYDQETGQADSVIRICGILLKPRKEKKHKTISDEADETVDDEPETVDDEAETVGDEENPVRDEDIVTEETKSCTDYVETEHKRKTGFIKKIRVIFGKIRDKLIKIKDFLLNFNPDTIAGFLNKKTVKIRKNLHRFNIFWNMKCTVKTRAYLKKYISSVLRHIAPDKIKGYVHFGFDEPYKTGRIIGYISMLPFVYQKNLVWEPDFYNKVMEGQIYFKGKIRIGYVLRIALNINIWKTIKASKKIKV